jgi:hypothetical protein
MTCMGLLTLLIKVRRPCACMAINTAHCHRWMPGVCVPAALVGVGVRVVCSKYDAPFQTPAPVRQRAAHEALQRLPGTAVRNDTRHGQPTARGACAVGDRGEQHRPGRASRLSPLQRACGLRPSTPPCTNPFVLPEPLAPFMHPRPARSPETLPPSPQVDDDSAAAGDDDELEGLDLAGEATAAASASGADRGDGEKKNVRMAAGVGGDKDGARVAA